MARGLVLAFFMVTCLSDTVRAQAQPAATPRGRALFIVDSSAYPQLKAGLEKYAAHVQREFGIACAARPDGYYAMKPAQIREILRGEYQKKDAPPLVGAIMVGPIPHALKGDPKEVLVVQTLFYEDFDAQWNDANGDGLYQDSEIINDRMTNPTEIWTTWWVPPASADDRAAQVRLLAGFLEKLDRYHRDELTGRDAMLWIAGNVAHVETGEGWSVLIKETLNPPAKPLNQALQIWCRFGQEEGTFRPGKRAEEFSAGDFLKAFTLQRWQLAHVITHGNARGWYWEGTGVAAGERPDGKPETVLCLDPAALHGAGANVVTTSGCSNGNFRGDYTALAYEKALGNALLFSPDTATIAYYGAASPQSTSGDPGFCTEIIEALRADGGSYLAEGYKKMRNMDYSWGTQHFFFRGGDEKVLSGDPFARFRPSPPPTAEQKKAIDDKIKAANWTIVGPG